MTTKKLWKCMLAGMESSYGNIGPWKIGKWRRHDGPLEMCRAGFHASENVIDAMQYGHGQVIAEVEVRGKHLEGGDKQAWSEMRILRAWDWTKEDSVSLAVYAAELVLGNYEKVYPGDMRPRKAIEAARAWLKSPTKGKQRAARSAAWNAWSAAESAAWSAAESAASAARCAAESAAWSAAESAAKAAAGAKNKCHAFVVGRLGAKICGRLNGDMG